jgi:hypothetical protein
MSGVGMAITMLRCDILQHLVNHHTDTLMHSCTTDGAFMSQLSRVRIRFGFHCLAPHRMVSTWEGKTLKEKPGDAIQRPVVQKPT